MDMYTLLRNERYTQLQNSETNNNSSKELVWILGCICVRVDTLHAVVSYGDETEVAGDASHSASVVRNPRNKKGVSCPMGGFPNRISLPCPH